MANVSIIGAGSWGTALAFLLHENGHQVTEWSAFENGGRESADRAPLKDASGSGASRTIWKFSPLTWNVP